MSDRPARISGAIWGLAALAFTASCDGKNPPASAPGPAVAPAGGASGKADAASSGSGGGGGGSVAGAGGVGTGGASGGPPDAPVGEPGNPAGSDAAAGASDLAAGDASGLPPATGGPLPGRTVLDRVRIGSHSKEDPHFQRAAGPLDLGAGPFARVQLTVALESSCFPFARWKDDPPPAGQSWPPTCDAFDRLFEVVLDPPGKPGDKPGVELIRAITPFGGPARYAADITDLVNGLPGAHTIEVHIDTWSDGAGKVSGSNGGWFVSASVDATAGAAPRDVVAVIPLFHDSQTMGTQAPLSFTIPAGATRARIETRATGHTAGAGPTDAACNGPAEEFCRRQIAFALDGQAIDQFMPYRTDCATLCTQTTAPGPSGRNLTYCAENPCGAIASVRASRANWCPGSLTPPHVIDRAVTPGAHQLGWDISAVLSGGFWRISSVVIAYR